VLGEALAELHQVTWPHPGEYSLAEETIVPLNVSYDQWLARRIHTNLAAAQRHSDRTTTADISWVEELIERGRQAINSAFTPCAVHHDYGANNTLAELLDGQWRITGVVDLMMMSIGDGEDDLPRQVAVYVSNGRPDLAAIYISTYLDRRPPRPGFAERAAVYMLDDRVDVWEYGQRHPDSTASWFDHSLTLRQWCEPYLEAISRLQ